MDMASNQGGNKGNKQTGNSGNQGNKGGASQQSGNAGNQGNKASGSKQSDTSKRGFASMDPEKQRAIAAEGGRAAHASGNAHEFTPEEAREAGKLSHGGNRQSGGNQGGNTQGGGNQGGRGGSGLVSARGRVGRPGPAPGWAALSARRTSRSWPPGPTAGTATTVRRPGSSGQATSCSWTRRRTTATTRATSAACGP